MGGQCSKFWRGKSKKNKIYKLEQNKAEVLTTVKRGERSSLHQGRSPLPEETGAIKTEEITKEEETFRKQGEERSEKNIYGKTVVQIKTTSPSHETHDSAPVSKKDKEACWVNNNSSYLIQNVTRVMAIADQLHQQGVIHGEIYANIRAAATTMEQMRELCGALRSTKAKSDFFRVLQETEPMICETEDSVTEVIKKHKAYLREKLSCEFEGTGKNRKDEKSLDKIYTELHIIQGESERVNVEHEIWEIEEKTRRQTAEGAIINCNDIFKSTTEDHGSSGQDRGAARPIRTVMTKGIAGIGKTVSVKKFIIDWADGKANQDIDFIFVLPFRELNLVVDRTFSLETLVREFHPELKRTSVARLFSSYKALFIFDGLDESQFKLDFKKAARLTKENEESSVDTVVTNLIREHLLPSAFVWITSRPGAVQRIPRQYVYQWTEVRGFNDPQKIQYFRKRMDNKEVAEKVIGYITTSRSLYIMCHIPIFCWIAAKVFEHLLSKVGNTNTNMPTTLTEMYTYFLMIQMQVATEKYDNLDGSDPEEVFKSNQEFIFKLGRMAFECLTASKIIFTANDLKEYGIDIDKAGVQCGLCTEVFKEENAFNRKILYCFVHLTVQEYFAALFVYHTFAIKKIDSVILKDFMLKESDIELEPILDEDPVDLPLNELIEITIANATLRTTGELDMFLRFLIGMSVQSTQELLQGMIQQTEEYIANVDEIRTSLLEIDLADCSAERCLNLVHCLIELKDSSLHDTVRQYLMPNNSPEKQLSPVQCSALADSILMSSEPLDEFNLKKYRPSPKGIFRLLPAVRNCRKARISGVFLNKWLSETIYSALQVPNSALTELHLINNEFYHGSSDILTKGLMNSESKLEALSLSGQESWAPAHEKWAQGIKSVISNLKELELSGNCVAGSLCSVVSVGLCQPKLEKLRLNRNDGITNICKELVTGLTSSLCNLREVELSHNNFRDSDMEILSEGLQSTHCTLELLCLSHNKLSDKGCQTLASVLSTPSRLREVDLSNNDLYDSGVMALSNALMKPNCLLKTLRLSFCRVTIDGCASLATALRSDQCSLRDLDLSFNHLTDEGVNLLTEIQRDPRCSLEELNVDQNEEYWFDWKLLRQYACDLTLDPDTANVNIILTEENKKATFIREKQPYPDHEDRFVNYQVLCKNGLKGRHYWEVELDSSNVAVAYKSIDRDNDCSSEFSFGRNEKSWCWCSDGSFTHNNSIVEYLNAKYICKIGMFLDWPAGILSFFEVSPDTLTHLHTAHATFNEPLHPGFCIEGSICLCKIK